MMLNDEHTAFGTTDTTAPAGPSGRRNGWTMRNHFHGELAGMSEQMVEMTRLVGSAISRATTALLDADLTLAESVITADQQIDHLQVDLEEQALELLARQQPVATDLRVLVTSLRISADLERMGDLARHVAKLARMRYPHSAVPAQLRATILQMGQVAERIVAKAGSVIATRDIKTAVELETDDDAMDALHREVFAVLLAPSWEGGIEAAIDVTLCGRYYERFADHAVSVAQRVVFLITGERETDDRDVAPIVPARTQLA
jgi:phosphate transport system protein